MDLTGRCGKEARLRLRSQRNYLLYMWIQGRCVPGGRALYLIKNGFRLRDEAGLLVRACGQIHISIEYENGEQQVILNGK